MTHFWHTATLVRFYGGLFGDRKRKGFSPFAHIIHRPRNGIYRRANLSFATNLLLKPRHVPHKLVTPPPKGFRPQQGQRGSEPRQR